MRFLSVLFSTLLFVGSFAYGDNYKQIIEFDGNGVGKSTLTWIGSKQDAWLRSSVGSETIINPVQNLQSFPFKTYSNLENTALKNQPCTNRESLSDVQITKAGCKFKDLSENEGIWTCQVSFIYGSCKVYVSEWVDDQGVRHYSDADGAPVDKDGNKIL